MCFINIHVNCTMLSFSNNNKYLFTLIIQLKMAADDRSQFSVNLITFGYYLMTLSLIQY